MIRICSKCKKEKSLEEFYKQKSGTFGRSSNCKICTKERSIFLWMVIQLCFSVHGMVFSSFCLEGLLRYI